MFSDKMRSTFTQEGSILTVGSWFVHGHSEIRSPDHANQSLGFARIWFDFTPDSRYFL